MAHNSRVVLSASVEEGTDRYQTVSKALQGFGDIPASVPVYEEMDYRAHNSFVFD